MIECPDNLVVKRWRNGTLLRKLYRLQKGRCCYCKRNMLLPFKHIRYARHTATREHLQRLCEGGTHHPDNIAVACQECNSTRQNTNWLEWATIRQAQPTKTQGQ